MDSEICHVMLAGHIYKLFVLSCFGHCCKTIFPHLSLMEAQAQFSAETGMQARMWPFHTTQSWDGHHQKGTQRLSVLYQSALLTPQHLMPVWPQCVSLWAARRENVFRLFCFFLGPYSWSACNRRRKGQMLYISGSLGPIPIFCLIVKKQTKKTNKWIKIAMFRSALGPTFHSCDTEITLTRLA